MIVLTVIITALIVIVLNLLINFIVKRVTARQLLKKRQKVLETNLEIDFSFETKTLKRVEVENPKAKILAVDDEEIILDSFRKILVLDGYSVDTVQTGQEVLGLIQKHHYDFVFVDLKMPAMSGVEVCKSVKYLRPDIDVIIITGYATVSTAVETMKYGAMDYVEKPFTEDELLEMVDKFLIRRQENIKNKLKPQVHMTYMPQRSPQNPMEFSIPGGVFISKSHCWVSLKPDGNVLVGIDDFAKQLIGKIDSIEMPNPGMEAKTDQPLFIIRQGKRSIPVNSPLKGKVLKINSAIANNQLALETTPYGKNWICMIEAYELNKEIPNLKIGQTAVSYYQEEIERFQKYMNGLSLSESETSNILSSQNGEKVFYISVQKLNDKNWQKVIDEFIVH